MDVSGIDVNLENFPHPRQKARQFFSAELVTRSTNDDVSVLADIEMRVLKTPDVEALCFVRRRRRRRFRLDDL